MSSAWGTSWGAAWGGSWGAIAAPVEEVQDQGRWAGEWLPIPVPKKYQPALPPKRKARVIATGPTPRAMVYARVINPVRINAALIVHDVPVAEVTCRVDNTIPNEEETIIAALAALL